MLKTPHPTVSISPQAELEQAREVLRAESSALLAVADRLGGSFLQAVDAMHQGGGSVVVTGMGKAGLIGQKIAATLSSTGTRSHYMHPAEACHGDLGCLGPGDVVLAFSHSGETQELTSILGPLRDLGIHVVGVTGRSSSTLAQRSDVVICYGAVEEACPIGLAPSASCAVMLAIGDALAFALMRRARFEQEDFGRFHPAGSLGKRLRPIEEVMRQGSQLRVADSQLTVREAFLSVQRPGRRTGAICLVDAAGRLVGLFTDSDLARLFESSDLSVLARPIAEFMTTHPITISTRALVRDAVEVFKCRQVSELPVVDEEDRLVGLVDITDLLDLLPEAA